MSRVLVSGPRIKMAQPMSIEIHATASSLAAYRNSLELGFTRFGYTREGREPSGSPLQEQP